MPKQPLSSKDNYLTLVDLLTKAKQIARVEKDKKQPYQYDFAALESHISQLLSSDNNEAGLLSWDVSKLKK